MRVECSEMKRLRVTSRRSEIKELESKNGTLWKIFQNVMIYLIGGPPKCGKTTLSKKISKEYGIPWISSDSLQVVTREYVRKYSSPDEIEKLYPHSVSRGKSNDENFSRNTPRQIAKKYLKQAKTSHLAIDMFILAELYDGNDFVIEGYHITPQLVSKLIKKHGKKHIKCIFLVKKDEKAFVESIHKSTTPNDWIIKRTTDQKKTYPKIAEMIRYFGEQIEKEAKKRKLRVLLMDQNFDAQIQNALKIFKLK